MNKINLIINIRIDFLRFSDTTFSQKLIILSLNTKLTTKLKSLTFTHILKRFITFAAF